MLINLFNTVKSSGVPCSLRELLDLIGALEARVTYSNMNDFYYHFCKVEFLCYAFKPNWLGWLVLIFGSLGILYIILRILASESFQEFFESSNNTQSYLNLHTKCI